MKRWLCLVLMIVWLTVPLGAKPSSKQFSMYTFFGLIGGVGGILLTTPLGLDPFAIGYPIGNVLAVNVLALLTGKPVKIIEPTIGAYWGGVFMKGASSLALEANNRIPPGKTGTVTLLALVPTMVTAYGYLELTDEESD